jgi:hypothetical protein
VRRLRGVPQAGVEARPLQASLVLSQEARDGLLELRIPKDLGDRLLEFQKAAVKIAAHHLNKRNGVLIGDAVGLGQTLMAAALARIFEDDHDLETLIICPKNLAGLPQPTGDERRDDKPFMPLAVDGEGVVQEA